MGMVEVSWRWEAPSQCCPEHCSLKATLPLPWALVAQEAAAVGNSLCVVLAARSRSQESENQLWEEDWSPVIPGEPLENRCLHGHTETWWVRGSEPRVGRVEPEIDFCLSIYGPCVTSQFSLVVRFGPVFLS